MRCARCHSTTCPGCPEHRDCIGCGYRFDAVYIDDRGRCAECAEKRATEDLADVAVSPEAIRVATTAAAESVRNQSARIAHDVLTAMGHPALARTVESAILNAGKVQVYG